MSKSGNNIEISVVIPAYKCEKCIEKLYERLKKNIGSISENYQIIFVNDGSPEADWEVIKDISARDHRITGLNLSRNFGQHAAITAGLDASSGKWIVVMDCDLQDRPEEIQKLYEKVREGYDIVYARRAKRKDGFLKRLSSKLFYKTVSYLTDTGQDETVANFGIYSRKAIDAYLNMNDKLRYFPVKIRTVGFSAVSVSVKHHSPKDRKSSYSYRKLFNLALDVMLATSDKPLKLVVKLGMFISASSFIMAIYFLFETMRGKYYVEGWPSMIVSIWFLSGIIILILGIVGLYVGKTFEETKRKPLYIIRENTVFKPEKENE